MSTYPIIRTQKDLARAVTAYLQADTDLPWRITVGEHDSDEADAIIHLDLNGNHYDFFADFQLKPSYSFIETLSSRPHPPNCPNILVAPRLTDRFVDLCRKAKISCLDLNGRVLIQRKGLFIDRSPKRVKNAIVASPPPPALFSAKSSRLIRALLASHAPWDTAELRFATGLSLSMLSRLLGSLQVQGFVQRDIVHNTSRWHCSQPDALLNEWKRQDIWLRRATVHQYTSLLPTQEFVDRLLSQFDSAQIAFTQWFAAQLRFPYTESPVISAYVLRIPDENLLKSLHAREVLNGGRIWLIEPKDEGVFQFTQKIKGVPLVSDAQIYIDLLQVSQRGPEAAQALRNWEGFRR